MNDINLKLMIMKKQILLFLTTILSITASAYDIKVENADGVTIYYDYINGKSCLEVTRPEYGYYYSGIVVIPEEVNYMKVTSIGEYAFSNSPNLISVTIPNSVTRIRKDAFWNCDGLTSITIPNSVTTIAENAFSGCRGLLSIFIPNSVESIGAYALADCSSLSSITVDVKNTIYDSRNNCNAIIETETNTLFCGCYNTMIPDDVTSIGDGAFYGHGGLTSITIPSSVMSIGWSAFAGCSSLSSLEIPKNVARIGDDAFTACSGLTSITVDEKNTKYDSRNNCNAIIETETNTLVWGCINTIIPNSVTAIGKDAFDDCNGLLSITIPNSVTTIGHCAFAWCDGLTSITISNGVTTIGDFAFWYCSGLTSITIPNSVTTIGGCAFDGCYGLTSITIPNSVKSIGYNAFYGCSISHVFSTIENPFAIETNTFSNETYNNAILCVPAGTMDRYKATDGWANFVYIVENMSSNIDGIKDKRMLRRYTLDGRMIKNSYNSINIIQMNNGTIKKVVQK